MPDQAAKVISIREEATSDRGLDDRIADAFVTTMTSHALAKLLAEVEETNVASQAESKDAALRAFDPRLRPAEVTDARRQMEDANFRSSRLDAAASQIKAMVAKAKAAEDAEVARAAHAAAIAERDQLVIDLAQYEVHAAAIASLLDRLTVNNAKLHMDEHAEFRARGAEAIWNVRDDQTLPKLLTTVRLPAFKRNGTNHGYVWPKPGAWG